MSDQADFMIKAAHRLSFLGEQVLWHELNHRITNVLATAIGAATVAAARSKSSEAETELIALRTCSTAMRMSTAPCRCPSATH